MSDERLYRQLLQAIVETARAIFAAEAASVFLLDRETSELVFEAASGAGSDELIGRRFPARTGIAGSVLMTGEPLIVDDLAHDPRFSREAAESTGYVPSALMAVPLHGNDEPLGVLQVLDRRDRSRTPLEELELLERFAAQAAIGLLLLQEGRRAPAGVVAGDLAARLSDAFGRGDPARADAGRRLLDALIDLLDA
jgi:GAF domain-containing protein